MPLKKGDKIYVVAKDFHGWRVEYDTVKDIKGQRIRFIAGLKRYGYEKSFPVGMTFNTTYTQAWEQKIRDIRHDIDKKEAAIRALNRDLGKVRECLKEEIEP